jgi:4-hydroxy-tetrahydrodipicolinate reductase
MNPLRVCVAGATGWAGSELSRAILHRAPDLTLVSAVSRTYAGGALAGALHDPLATAPVYATAAEALAVGCDVFVEYTEPGRARAHALAALQQGAHVVVGTSGLTAADFSALDAAAQAAGRGVLACGNFALTAVLLQRFAEQAAKLIGQWEIIDYASDQKVDAPSGTARELASRLAAVRTPVLTVPIGQTVGAPDARGTTLLGSQIHSVRLPGHVLGIEAIFGMADQRLSLRHDAGGSAEPYVDGALLAIRKVGTLRGLHRGLDVILKL